MWETLQIVRRGGVVRIVGLIQGAAGPNHITNSTESNKSHNVEANNCLNDTIVRIVRVVGFVGLSHGGGGTAGPKHVYNLSNSNTS